MWSDRVSNPGPLTYESGALPTALRGPEIPEKCEFLAQRYQSQPITTTSQTCCCGLFNLILMSKYFSLALFQTKFKMLYTLKI